MPCHLQAEVPHLHAHPRQRLDGLRARSAQDKDLRRSHLVQAAAALFAQTDFDGVTIARVASCAGVAKGTAYLYFSCKEALFLELVQLELLSWESTLSHALAAVPAADKTVALPEAIASTLSANPTLLRLIVLLHTVIEPQLDLPTAHAFKVFLRDFVDRMAHTIAAGVPQLGTEAAATLLLQTHALVIGVSQLASPPPVIAQVLAADKSLQGFQIAFKPFLVSTLTTLLQGALTMPQALRSINSIL